MTLFFSLLPVYLFGNFHCMGMCGPLVMMIGQHRYRLFYFAGRTLSFTLAAALAGEVGAVLNLSLQPLHLSALISFFFAAVILAIGALSLMHWRLPTFLGGKVSKINHSLSFLMLRDLPWPTFLFGFFTVALPCGQTLLVFSACALVGDPIVGLINGFLFALITSPSLFLAMQAHRLMRGMKRYYSAAVALSALLVGGLALCRGFAELGWINHWVLSEQYHIVLF